jgi:hypothetical protein
MFNLTNQPINYLTKRKGGKKSVKLKILLLSFLAVFLLAGSGFAYTIDDPSNDAIGTGFESYGIDAEISGGFLYIDLYTDFDGEKTVGQWTIYYADLAIDLDQNGVYEYGFALKSYDGTSDGGISTEKGYLYENVTAWFTSDNHKVMDSTGGSYYYNHDFYTTIKQGTKVTNLNNGFSIAGDYTISIWIDLNDLGDLGSAIDILWGTATCANDVVKGTANVPEPSTMLLFGTGFLGLAMIGRKKLFKK